MGEENDEDEGEEEEQADEADRHWEWLSIAFTVRNNYYVSRLAGNISLPDNCERREGERKEEKYEKEEGEKGKERRVKRKS